MTMSATSPAPRTAGSAVRRPSTTSTARWTSPALIGTVVLAVATLVPALAAATSPLVAPNQNQELGFPLVAAPLGVVMVLIAGRLMTRTPSRWAGLLAASGALWVGNALLVALRSAGADGRVPHGLFVGATWLEQWFYVLPDLATLLLLPLALPHGRMSRRWRIAAIPLGIAAATQVFAGAFGSGPMDDTQLANPVALGHANTLIALRDDLYLPTLVFGLLLVLLRAVVLRRSAGRRQVPVQYSAALVVGVLAALIGTVAEGALEAADLPSWGPWMPVAITVLGAVVVWARAAARSAETMHGFAGEAA